MSRTGGEDREEPSGIDKGASDAAAVLTVTTNGVLVPFEIAKLPGRLQAATKGTPLQVKLTVPLKPAPGVT